MPTATITSPTMARTIPTTRRIPTIGFNNGLFILRTPLSAHACGQVNKQGGNPAITLLKTALL